MSEVIGVYRWSHMLNSTYSKDFLQVKDYPKLDIQKVDVSKKVLKARKSNEHHWYSCKVCIEVAICRLQLTPSYELLMKQKNDKWWHKPKKITHMEVPNLGVNYFSKTLYFTKNLNWSNLMKYILSIHIREKIVVECRCVVCGIGRGTR